MFLPRGLMHGFTARTDLCRALVIMSPGGLEVAFREFSEPMATGLAEPPPPVEPPPVARLLDTFRGHGVQFPPPDATAPDSGRQP